MYILPRLQIKFSNSVVLELTKSALREMRSVARAPSAVWPDTANTALALLGHLHLLPTLPLGTSLFTREVCTCYLPQHGWVGGNLAGAGTLVWKVLYSS